MSFLAAPRCDSPPFAVVVVPPSVRPPRRASDADGDGQCGAKEHVEGRKERRVAERTGAGREVGVEVDAQQHLEDQRRRGDDQPPDCTAHRATRERDEREHSEVSTTSGGSARGHRTDQPPKARVRRSQAAGAATPPTSTAAQSSPECACV